MTPKDILLKGLLEAIPKIEDGKPFDMFTLGKLEYHKQVRQAITKHLEGVTIELDIDEISKILYEMTAKGANDRWKAKALASSSIIRIGKK